MRYFKVIAAVLALGLSGCFRSQEPLNPPVLVTARDTDMAIQLFMQANILLAQYYGFESVKYSELRDRSVRHGYEVLPFMPPIDSRAVPPLARSSLHFTIRDEEGVEFSGKAFRNWAKTKYGADVHRKLVSNYVQTGWRATQLICRNYMVGLDERNRYLEFLQREFNIGAGLANAFFTIANANVTALSVLQGMTVGTNLTIDAYQDYRFLTIDRDLALGLVEAAQNTYAMDYLRKINALEIPPVPQKKGDPAPLLFPVVSDARQFTLFSDAIQVLNKIEYQCTRSGIRALLNNAAARVFERRLTIDPLTNALKID